MLSRRALLSSACLLSLLASLPVRAQASQEKLMPVVASFSILGDIVQNVGGSRIALTTLVQPGSDAHVYAPTPTDAKTVSEARIVFSNGLKFEGWMTRLMQSSASKARLVEASKGIKQRIEPASHGHGATDKHGHDHGGLDPHAWQSIANVKIYVVNIRDALTSADPAGKDAYAINADAYLQELDRTDTAIKALVATIPPERRKVITSHDAFGYFAQAYGLSFIAPRGISTEAEASAKDVAKLILQIKKEKVPAVFIENISDQRLIQQIAKDTGAKVGGTLYSDALSAADGPAPTYIRMMQHNIKMLSEALVPKS